MNEQTAMQQLINEIVEHLTYDDNLSDDSRMTLETIRLRCLGKLLIEKEQHAKTWDAALDKYEARAGNYIRAYEDFDDYYEQFKNK